ncbi:MAG: type IX secretion system membrane protein PorP/SprF [Bacteroidales bacterium]|nr:type IX secretion system membrane protein PorP/SprF [Bacteroidales bacterium]
MRKRLVILIAIWCIPLPGKPQDRNILFSQYTYNGLSLNPSYAGSHDVFSASFLSRQQWIGFEGAPRDFALNLHGPGKNTKTGWGINMMYETIGIRNTFGFFANYAYRLSLGPGILSMGIKAGFASGSQKVLNISDNGKIDPAFSDNTASYFLPNFGIGFYYYTNKVFAGLSVPLILGYKSNNDGSIIAYHDFSKYAYWLTAGIRLSPGNNWQITPSVITQYEISSGIVLDGTVNVLYRETFGVGLGYRTSGALIMNVSYRIGYQTTVGLAYDFGLGGINQYNRNSIEIAVQVDLGFKINRSNPIVF